MRETYLKEMGLWPVWRLRSATPQQGPESAAPVEVVSDLKRVSPQDLVGRSAAIQQMDWQALRQSVAECAACNLSEFRQQTVFGVGDQSADWLFVGEAPGAEEDASGEPFVGASGQLLDNMLRSIKLNRRKNVYITNVVKCHPVGNHDPKTNEATACEPYLKRQITLIQPKLIVALGAVAAHRLLNTDESIAHLRGAVHTSNGIPLIVTYHPAYLLRSPQDKAKVWDDLCFAVKTMNDVISVQDNEFN
ncbi:uracil-DNA glycosylase [Sulfurirhabdus autotrophica]|uniref:Type-4 uracil-DNA glycosylase n=1 Tax=Sulfurirhabdus autotrophica TaxID=1706046 RepID=A0A4V2W330_9PROT|nr:uracil-DNA glycosylase [Sulfurirhabdus autotrophica]TCV90329.1 DNA polymerase [Sulfurirhabdus autotrophica]